MIPMKYLSKMGIYEVEFEGTKVKAILVDHEATLDAKIAEFKTSLQNQGCPVLGIDFKVNSCDNKVELLILCGVNHCLLIKLPNIHSYPHSLSEVLPDRNLFFVGFGIRDKIPGLTLESVYWNSDDGKPLTFYMNRIFEVCDLAAKVLKKPKLCKCGLAELDKEVRINSTVASTASSTLSCPVTDSKVKVEIASLPDSKVKVEIASLHDSKVTVEIASLPDSKVTVEKASLPDSKVTVEIASLSEKASLPDSKVTVEIASLPDSKVTVEKASLPNSKVTVEKASLPDSKVTVEIASLSDSKIKVEKASLPDLKVKVVEIASLPDSKDKVEIASLPEMMECIPDWKAVAFSDEEIKYAIYDAYTCCFIGYKMLELLDATN